MKGRVPANRCLKAFSWGQRQCALFCQTCGSCGGAVLLYGLLLLCVLPQAGRGQAAGVEAGAGQRLFSSSGPFVEIVGTDARSVSYMLQLADHVIEQSNRFLKHGGKPLPDKLFLTLRPDEAATFEGDFRYRFVERGGVYLDFRWGRDLEFETALRAVVTGYLLRYANFHYGPEAHRELRQWVISSIVMQSYLSLRPAQYASLFEAQRRAGIPDIYEIFAEAWHLEASPRTQREGYWVVAVARQNLWSRSLLLDAVEGGLMGADISEPLEDLLRGSLPEAESLHLGQWWAAQMNELLARDEEIYERLPESRRWIEILAQLNDFEADDSDDGEAGERLRIRDLRDLWKHRENTTVREILEARSELIRLRLTRVNPAYFNAARSLGALYEIVLEGDRAHEFLFALTTFLSDFEDTRRLEETVLQRMKL